MFVTHALAIVNSGSDRCIFPALPVALIGQHKSNRSVPSEEFECSACGGFVGNLRDSGNARPFDAALNLHQKGDLDGATLAYLSILRDQPTHFGAAYMLGTVFLQKKRFDDAERQIRRALQINPKSAEAFNSLGLALKELERYDEALASCDRAVALNPDFAEAHCRRGNVRCLLAQLDGAIASYDCAIALRPDYADAFFNRGAALELLSRWDDAIASYENALALQTDFPEANNNLGNSMIVVGRHEEALASFNRAIALRPNYAEALTNRGNVLRILCRHDEALVDHNRAVALRPKFSEAFNNRGCVYRDLQQFDAAIEDFQHAADLNPRKKEARWNIALTQLLLGRWEEGWEGYDLRFSKEQNASRRPNNPAPLWEGEPLAGKRILAFGEQGFGDAIQFVRYISVLLARGAEVTVCVNRRLHRLLSTAAPGVKFIGAASSDTAFDYQIALMSIPRVLNQRVEDLVAPERYLCEDVQRRATWHRRLGAHGFRLGLCWQGNPAGSIDQGRSVPLREFLPLARIPNLRIISLQKNFGVEQLDKVQSEIDLEKPGRDFDEGDDAFADTAAIMANLDLVITSDTSIAHLAGALGRPVWIALKRVPDWRWLLDRHDTPWYPTARLFRQVRDGDWSSVIGTMAAELWKIILDAKPNPDLECHG